MIFKPAARSKSQAAGSVSKVPPFKFTARRTPVANAPAISLNRPVKRESSAGTASGPLRGWAVPQSTIALAEADLKRSVLTIEQARANGVQFVDSAREVNPGFAPKPVMVFPYFDARRRPATYIIDDIARPVSRVRYLVPQGFSLPKGQRYDQPADSGTPPYFPLCCDFQRVLNGEVDAVAVVEGEKKSIAMCEAGIPTIGIGGVWNIADGSAPLHPSLVEIFSKCKDLYIVYDSDVLTNPNVQTAEWRLASRAAQLGCRIHLGRLPQSAELEANGKPKKIGADDFLAEKAAVGGGGAAALEAARASLRKLILDTPALGEERATASSSERIAVADLLKREVTPVEELIPGWIEKGIPNFLCGPGGVHKSRLAMQWGLCLTAGAAVWGLGASLMQKPLATLVYVSAEDDANELARRAQGICSALKIKPPSQGIFVPRAGKDSALVHMLESADMEVRPFYFELTAMLRSIPGHKVVVLDSAYDFVRFMGKAKIDEDSVNYFVKVVLQGICDQCDATLIIPWHPSQAGSERDTMDGWSVAWHNAPRMRLSLKAVKDVVDTYELSVAKRNHGRKGEPIQLRYCDGALLPLAALPDDGKRAALRQIVVKAAIDAATAGVPINRRGRPPSVIAAEAEKALGRRPSQHEIREELEAAAIAVDLRYIGSENRHCAAGYYPPDTALANELAHAAKRAARSSGDA